MVIGFDGSRAFVPLRTGTENYSYQLLLNLSKIDKINNYIVYTRSSKLPLDWPKNFQFKHINWPRLWTQGGLALQTFLDNLDVLFVPAHTLPLIRKFGLKTIVTVHDLGSEFLPLTHQVKQRLYLSLMQNYQLKTVTKIIAVSGSTKKDLIRKIGIQPDKITVVYEGYDKNLFKSSKGDVLINSLRQYGLESGQYFLFVGTVQPRKNLERLIKAFKQFIANEDNSIQLAIAGSTGWMSEEIYSLPKHLGIEGRVKFLGYVPSYDLPVLYSSAIALTFPSLFEGFGLPLLEAQASGCPVITSNTSSMPEIAGEGAILVNPYNTPDITRAMIEVRIKKTRVKLIEAGIKNIKRFSWEKCAAQTLSVFEKLI